MFLERNLILKRIYRIIEYCLDNNIDISNIELKSLVKTIRKTTGLQTWSSYQYAKWIKKIDKKYRQKLAKTK